MNPRPPGYEPGELPGCSTPRRGGQYTSVDAFFWAALGFLIVAAVGGAVYVGMRAWRAWVVFTSFAAGGLAGAEALAVRAEQLGTHAERTSGKADELAAAVERLQRSLRRAKVLVDATADIRGAVRAVLAFGRSY